MSTTTDVIALYTKYLNRTPESTDPEVVAYVQDIDAGKTSLSQVEIDLKGTNEYKVIQLYQKYLHRFPDASGLASWLASLAPNGPISYSQLEKSIAGSNEAYIVLTFNSILGRDPTTTEINAWASRFDSGESRSTLDASLKASDEVYAEQVTLLYKTILERDPEPEGLASWIAALNNKTITLDGIRQALLNSDEYKSKHTTGTTPTIKIDPNNLEPSLKLAWKQLFGVALISSDLTFYLKATTATSVYSGKGTIMADDTGVNYDINLPPAFGATASGTSVDIAMSNAGTSYAYSDKIANGSDWAVFQVYNGTNTNLTPVLSVINETANVNTAQTFKQYGGDPGAWLDMNGNELYLPVGQRGYIAVNIQGAFTLKGVGYWVQQINSGALSVDNVEAAWKSLPEYQIVLTYKTLLNRLPDEAAFNHWTAGLTLYNVDTRVAELTQVIKNSDEYKKLQGQNPSTDVTSTSNSQTIELESKETRAYVYTYVSILSEESAPSDPILVDLYPGTQTATITMESPPTGNFNLQMRRIYRTAVGTAGTNYYFVAEIPIGQQVYEDAVKGTDLGEPLPSLNWSEPPADLDGLIAMPNGFLAGFTGRDVYFSEAYHLHAWPIDYMQSVDYPVVGLGQFGQSLVVLTTGSPYLLTGTDPASMTLEKLEFEQACLSARSICRLGGGVVYASPDGLAYIGPDGMQVLTENFFTRKEWQTLNPASIVGEQHDNRYYAYFNDGTNKGGFILDPKSNGSPFVFTDQYFDGLYNDLRNDALYGVYQGAISKLEGGTSLLNYTWRSKQFLLPKPINFKCAQVVAADYTSLTVKFYVDGLLVHTVQPTSQNPFKLPAGFKGRVLEVELIGTSTVIAVHVAESMEELRNV